MFTRDGHRLVPFMELRAVAEGKTRADIWSGRCAELGIGSLPLCGAAVAAV